VPSRLAPACGIYVLTIAAQFPLHQPSPPLRNRGTLMSRRQPFQQVHQAKQIRHAKQASARCQRRTWIGLYDARPRGGHGPQPALLVVKTHPVLSPGLVPRDDFEFAAVLRVERMGYPDDSLCFVPIPCS
jgi:hypothetical protein